VRIAIAEASDEARRRLRPQLGGLQPEVREARDGPELERLLTEEGPFDLVITSAQLAGMSGLSVLTRARRNGDTTPFVVVTLAHQERLHIFVSTAEGTVLASRMVNARDLASLSRDLIAKFRG
jgi:CheY-like chemotaxis protein